MTVGELRKKLEGIDPETNVVVQWEIDREPTYFDVWGVSVRKGTPSITEKNDSGLRRTPRTKSKERSHYLTNWSSG